MSKVVNKHPHASNGARIRRYRLELPRSKRSQQTVAAAVGISRRQLIRCEKGESLPSAETRDRLAEYLGCDRVEIDAYDDDEESSGDMSRDLLQAAVQKFVDMRLAELAAGA